MLEYLKSTADDIKKMKRAAVEDLYVEIIGHDDKQTIRWMGANDRYFLLTVLLRRVDARDDWIYGRCREVEEDTDDRLDLWARDHYKLCYQYEHVPTPDGWAYHGELSPGDEVFAADGKPCRVIAKTPVFQAPPEHLIIFDDGTSIISGDDHIWPIERHTRKRVPMAYNKPGPKRIYRETVLMTTREIAEHDHRQDRRLMVKIAGPLELPVADLPIDPYLLGAWLGDGTASTGQITCGDDIWSGIIKTDKIGVDTTPNRKADRRTIECLTTRLRAGGLLRNKHIPPPYLRASVEQRLALLQGLMDSDGHCDTRGTATFVNINERLARNAEELILSLGMKPSLRFVNGKYKGEPYPYWQLSFQAHKSMPPFRLPRKLARCLEVKRGRSAGRYIVSCERVGPIPGSCIQVDSPDGTYLVGKSMIPTHNSTIITFAGTIQEILKDPEITIGIFAHIRPIAKNFLWQIKQEFEDNKFLQEIYPDILYDNPAKQSPRWSLDDGIICKRRSNPHEGTVEAWGIVDGMPAGKHFQLRIYDDLITERNVTTPDMIKKTTLAWELSQNLGRRDGRMWHIGTRYHFGDTYGVIIQRGAVKERRHPATHDGTFDGIPVFLTQKQWDRKITAESKTTIAAQQLLNPLAGSETTFSIETLKMWDVRPERLSVYIMVDPSKGKHRTSDDTAVAIIGISATRGKYLLDGLRHKMPLSKRWETLKNMYRRWIKMPGIVSVNVGYEQYGMQTDMEYFEKMMEIEQFNMPIEEVSWTRQGQESKKFRIERLEPDFRTGRMMIPHVMTIDERGNIDPYNVEDTNIAKKVIAEKRGYLVAKPMHKIDENGRKYDVLGKFLEEFIFFPFAGDDHFLDAMSRIYDMDPVPPVHYDHVPGHRMSVEPETFFDS